MFGRIAGCYDFFNRIFTLGLDCLWRRRLVHALEREIPVGRRILDLATGSGDVALALQKRGWDVTGADFCAPLLEKAREKGVRKLVEADAHHLPFENECFDAVTIAFGFRNFQDRAKALDEIHRVLKPDGWLFLLEFSNPQAWFKPFHHLHTCHLMPGLAHLLQRRGSAYRYLNDTIEAFPDADDLAVQIASRKFGVPSWTKYCFGSVALHQAQKQC
jgi:demethylmenaquinone methyltransferase/2-methoxy-6-polyprenyl-1,4-benzoquinol methylase